MPTSAHGSEAVRAAPGHRPRGFTLLELLIVVALIALASSVAALALRDPSQAQLEREATRLAALLESARAYSRSTGTAVWWSPTPGAHDADHPDFRFSGLQSRSDLPDRWLDPDVQASVSDPRGILLGPEPIIGAQSVTLALGDRRSVVASDGLGPFTVVDADATSGAR